MSEPADGFNFDDQTPVKMPARWFVGIVVAVAAGVAAWTLTQREVANHERRLDVLESKIDDQRQILLEIRSNTRPKP